MCSDFEKIMQAIFFLCSNIVCLLCDNKSVRERGAHSIGPGLGFVQAAKRPCLHPPEPGLCVSNNTGAPARPSDSGRQSVSIVLARKGSHLHIETPGQVETSCRSAARKPPDRPLSFQANRSNALFQHTEPFRTGAGKVNDPVAHKGATVIDAHHNGPAVLQVGDSDPGSEGQELVRGSHGVLIVAFAVGGKFPVKSRAIPGGDAFFPESV